MKHSFPYPIPVDALETFCVPHRAMHPLARPCRGDGEMLAGNGYAVIRAYRGGWLDRDFPAATPEFLGRIGKIPWARFVKLPADDWRLLDSVAGSIWARGVLGFWQDGTARVAPTPIWRVGGVLVRLSLLQLVARLPRAEVAWTDDADSPLWFRFSGGRGAIAMDRNLQLSSFSIFQAREDVLTGELVKRKPAAPLRLVQPGVDWPPVDLSE